MADNAPPAEVRLICGRVALVDAADFEVVRSHKWHANGKRTLYAKTNIDGRIVSMHRLILSPGHGVLVDHINHDGLDNTRKNIRLCTHAENMRNRTRHGDFSSRFKGVWLDKRSGRWLAKINHENHVLKLGSFDDEVRAARQYDRAARLMFGEFACTNETMGLL
jgi:hypothetical protein